MLSVGIPFLLVGFLCMRRGLRRGDLSWGWFGTGWAVWSVGCLIIAAHLGGVMR